jgi:hypothetical protein
MPPNLKADIEWLRKDAKLWSGSAQTLGGFATSAVGSKISSPFGQPSAGDMAYDPYTLIQDFLDAYNKFCQSFHDRAKKGHQAMEAMSTTLVGVANAFQAADTPR